MAPARKRGIPPHRGRANSTRLRGRQQEGKGPRQEGKGPRQEGKGPRQEGKGPRQEGKGPRQESKGRQQESKGPRQESKGRQQESKGHHRETGENRMKLGFIGTGNMGNPMAANLIKAGHQVTVHDLRREVATNLLEMGAEWADSPRGAVPGNDAVLTSLPVPRDVEAVVRGEGGILEGAGNGTVIFDLSTNSPTIVRNLHQECAARGVTLLDSPVSGGTYGAAAGTLAVMVGGDRATFDRFESTLGAIGNHVVYCGDIGAGSVCKICNNLMSMGIGVLLSEALTLGVKAGVDLAILADVIAHSSGSSRRLTEKFARFLFQGNFEPGFATALAAKDVRLATDLGREYGVPMDLSNLVDQRHVEAMFRGFGPEDSDAVARIQEEKAGVQLRLNV